MKNYDQISLDDYSFKQVEVRLYLKEGETLYSPEPISSPVSAINVLSELMKDLDREMVAVVNLDAKNRPMNYNIVSIGSINTSLAPIQNIMKSAILSNAASIMLAHNHPSGDCTPSRQDYELTVRLVEAGKLLEIPVLDHLILGGDGDRYSFREHNPELFTGPYKKEVLSQNRKKNVSDRER